MAEKITIKNRFTDSIIFESESEDNTILKTVLLAIDNDANLRGANLRGANLRDADLRDADLRDADLRYADLRYANLQDADLQDANLRYANLQDADLRGADLRGADLQGADLRGADLRGADLQGATYKSFKVTSLVVFSGIYKYICVPYITENNEKRITLGCFDRSLDEWCNDFWNNNKEFPNDNSKPSKERLMAFELSKMWLDIHFKETQR